MRSNLGTYRFGTLAAVVASLALWPTVVRAQFAGPAVGPPSSTPGGTSQSAFHLEYGAVRIKPGDVIAIATPGVPELTTTALTTTDNPGSTANGNINGIKVGAQGEVVLPYLGVVTLGGLTPEEASAYLDKELTSKGILVDPQVTVSLVDSPTRVITVVGEVQRPQPVPASGQLRLMDVISACGGFTPLASHDITIQRPGDPNGITVILGPDPKSSDQSNIPLMAGDTVIVPKVGNVFVVGQVKTPSAIPLSSNAPITVMRAIAMAGGLNFGAALSKSVIIRRLPDNQRVEIQLDLKKIMHGKEKDVALASDDVLLIPTSGVKAALAGGGYGVVTAASGAAIYRIP